MVAFDQPATLIISVSEKPLRCAAEVAAALVLCGLNTDVSIPAIVKDEQSTEWRDRGIIPNEHLASGTDEPWSTWRSLNRLRVQKGCCRAMMKMWKLSHTDVCDCGERQTMSHLMTCDDAPNCTWTGLAFPTLAGVNCAKHWEESI